MCTVYGGAIISQNEASKLIFDSLGLKCTILPPDVLSCFFTPAQHGQFISGSKESVNRLVNSSGIGDHLWFLSSDGKPESRQTPEKIIEDMIYLIKRTKNIM